MEACHAHPEVEARWRCSFCGLALCDDCVDVRSLKDGEVRACGDCGGRADPIAASAGARPAPAPEPAAELAPPPSPTAAKGEPGDGPTTPPADLGTEIVRALTWPFAKDALPTTLWAVAVCIGFGILAMLAAGSIFAPAMVIVYWWVLVQYDRFLVRVIGSTAAGKDTIPDLGLSGSRLAPWLVLEGLASIPWMVSTFYVKEPSLGLQLLCYGWSYPVLALGLSAFAYSSGGESFSLLRWAAVIKRLGGALLAIVPMLVCLTGAVVVLVTVLPLSTTLAVGFIMFSFYFIRLVMARLLGRLYVRDPKAFEAFGG